MSAPADPPERIAEILRELLALTSDRAADETASRFARNESGRTDLSPGELRESNPPAPDLEDSSG